MVINVFFSRRFIRNLWCFLLAAAAPLPPGSPCCSLFLGPQGGLQKPVVQEKGPTRRFREHVRCFFSRLFFSARKPRGTRKACLIVVCLSVSVCLTVCVYTVRCDRCVWCVRCGRVRCVVWCVQGVRRVCVCVHFGVLNFLYVFRVCGGGCGDVFKGVCGVCIVRGVCGLRGVRGCVRDNRNLMRTTREKLA